MKRASSGLAALLMALAVQTASAAPPGAAPGALTKIEGRVALHAIPAPKTPRDPAVDAEGRVYFSMSGADRIVRFDPASGQFKEWGLPADTKPTGLAIGRDGHVFFAGNDEGVLGELDPDSGSIRQYRTSSRDSRPYSVTIDAQGNVWMTLRAGGIAMLDRSSGKLTEHRMEGSPYALAFDQRGILWVTCIEAGTLRYFDPKTRASGELSFGLGARPRRVAVAPDGTIWVTLYGAGKLVAVDGAARKVLGEYSLPGGPNAGPYSVLVDARGRVWVAEFQTDSVVVLEPPAKQFRVIRLPEARSGVRNAALDGKGRHWYVATTTGKLGVIE